MPKAVISTIWRVEGTSGEIADLAAEIDRRFKETFEMEMNYLGIKGVTLDQVYVGTFITHGVKSS